MTGITRVAVIGTGVLGSQIMMQAAYHGKKVIGYGISDELLAQLPQRWEWMRGFYADDLPDFDAGRFDEAIAAIEATTDIGVAVKDVDLVIEAVPENLELKREVWSEIGRLAPEETLFATNTSALLPSDFAEATGRTDRFLALHFANMIWRYNTGEVMRTPMTSQQTFDTVLAFAGEIGLEPIAIEKETPGYVLNGLLDPGSMEDPSSMSTEWPAPSTSTVRGVRRRAPLTGLLRFSTPWDSTWRRYLPHNRTTRSCRNSPVYSPSVASTGVGTGARAGKVSTGTTHAERTSVPPMAGRSRAERRSVVSRRRCESAGIPLQRLAGQPMLTSGQPADGRPPHRPPAASRSWYSRGERPWKREKAALNVGRWAYPIRRATALGGAPPASRSRAMRMRAA